MRHNCVAVLTVLLVFSIPLLANNTDHSLSPHNQNTIVKNFAINPLLLSYLGSSVCQQATSD